MPQTQDSTFGKRWAPSPSVLWLLVLTLACLVPFAHKAVHIDDTLFLRAAEHIQKHPADFYGFSMNWFGSSMPMVRVFENPPLTCYYIALVASAVGWSETALHLAFLLPAVAAAWGTFSLARHHCNRPIVAGLVAVLTPVFLVSATTLMCDVTLVALWVWCLAVLEKGLQNNRWSAFLGSGLLGGMAVLTKFPGLALVPLITAYGLAKQRRPGKWLIAPLLPLLFAVGYDAITRHLYGQGLLFAAAAYASETGAASWLNRLARAVPGLSFMGGCFLPALFYAPFLWSRQTILKGLCFIAPCALLLAFMGKLDPPLWNTDGTLNWSLCVQATLFIGGGIVLAVLACADFWTRRDAVSLLLLLWVLGIFVFATAVNWIMNGRSLLVMAPALGILVARRLDQHQPGPTSWILWPVIPAAALSLFLVKADYDLAESARAAAKEICARYSRPGTTLWFEGHWGFQYYMEQLGARALDLNSLVLTPGQFVVLPSNENNTSIYDLSSSLLRFTEVRTYAPNPHCTTMSPSVGAGFYAALQGPLPFAVGEVEPEHYYVFEFAPDFAPGTRPAGGLSKTGALARQLALEKQLLACRRALGANPNDALAHLELGQLLSSRFAYAEAGEHFRQALRSKPDSIEAMIGLAWILAAAPDARLRNSREAMELAEHADGASGHSSINALRSLAAAYADASRFPEAVATAARAVDLARATGDGDSAMANQKLLDLYRAGKPYHEQARGPKLANP
jgi:4-amino-4-deoxy-L-arabinose transferase-like glycosyltransferase/tetratricopeptide (TPR) repeat protein